MFNELRESEEKVSNGSVEFYDCLRYVTKNYCGFSFAFGRNHELALLARLTIRSESDYTHLQLLKLSGIYIYETRLCLCIRQLLLIYANGIFYDISIEVYVNWDQIEEKVYLSGWGLTHRDGHKKILNRF